MTRSGAAALDERDPLRDFRSRFIIDEDAVYLDGNSLGSLPRSTVERLQRVVNEQWGVRGIRGTLVVVGCDDAGVVPRARRVVLLRLAGRRART